MTNFINSVSFEEEFEAAKKEESKFAEEASQAASGSKPWHKKTSDHQSFESWRKQNNKEQASAPISEQSTPSKGKYSVKPHQQDRDNKDKSGYSRNYSNYGDRDRDRDREAYDHTVFDDVKDVSSKERKGRYAVFFFSSPFFCLLLLLVLPSHCEVHCRGAAGALQSILPPARPLRLGD
jgi:hypothetical protein